MKIHKYCKTKKRRIMILRILISPPLVIDKIVGTAAPKKEESEIKKMTWCLSTGDVLSIQWESALEIILENENIGEQVMQRSWLYFSFFLLHQFS